MRARRQAPVWGALLDGAHAREKTGWYQQLRDWWTAHHAARREAAITFLSPSWDATREAVIPWRADAALDMAATHGARSAAMLLYSLGV